jgi:hypothetical protein
LDRVKTLRINPILSTVALALALFFTLYKFWKDSQWIFLN